MFEISKLQLFFLVALRPLRAPIIIGEIGIRQIVFKSEHNRLINRLNKILRRLDRRFLPCF